MENFDLEKFKDYVNTYDKQIGHKGYSKKIIIDDFLYGMGICFDEEKYKHATGYSEFKKVIMEHLNAVPESMVPKKCSCGNLVNTEDFDCVTYSLCKDCAMDS